MPRTKTESTRVNIYLPNKELGILKALAKKRSTTYSQIVRDAVRLWLKTEAERLRKGPR